VYRYFVSQSSEFCRHNRLCCFTTSVVDFVIDSVRRLLDTPNPYGVAYFFNVNKSNKRLQEIMKLIPVKTVTLVVVEKRV
jgi:hypothetical protein